MKGSLKAAMDMPMRTGQMRARGEAKRQKRIFEQQEDYEAVDIGFAKHGGVYYNEIGYMSDLLQKRLHGVTNLVHLCCSINTYLLQCLQVVIYKH